MKTTAKKSRHSNGNITTPRVRLELTHPTAKTVCIAGTFNDWHPAATEMVNLGNGRWAKELTLPPGAFEYRLVVDGENFRQGRSARKNRNGFPLKLRLKTNDGLHRKIRNE